MPTKTCAVLVKATAADDSSLTAGQFTALASVFGNVDDVGDVVMPGAFTADLKAWKESGDPIPLLWGHQMQDPDMNLGEVLEATETDIGLQIKAELDIENNPKAAQVYRLIKGKRVRKMSFAYDVEDGAPAERDGRRVYELRKLKLHEVSVVQVPANPAAAIQQVKEAAERAKAMEKAQINVAVMGSDPAALGQQVVDAIEAHAAQQRAKATEPDAKAGRALSAKNESALRKALDQISAGMVDIGSVLDSLDTISNDGKANPAEPATAEEPSGVKTDSPASRSGPASFRLRAGLAEISADAIALDD